MFLRHYRHLPHTVRKMYWDIATKGIDSRWRLSQHDYGVLTRVVEMYRPSRVLDIGCGTGRLFPLLQSKGISVIVGLDVSRRAIEMARARHKGVLLVQCSLEDLSLPESSFDLILSNRVLQNLPPSLIDTIISKLCRLSPLIYINELTESDGLDTRGSGFKHDYKRIFSRLGYEVDAYGLIRAPASPGFQTYYVFRHRNAGGRSTVRAPELLLS